VLEEEKGEEGRVEGREKEEERVEGGGQEGGIVLRLRPLRGHACGGWL
jgi:hypothetical protein